MFSGDEYQILNLNQEQIFYSFHGPLSFEMRVYFYKNVEGSVYKSINAKRNLRMNGLSFSSHSGPPAVVSTTSKNPPTKCRLPVTSTEITTSSPGDFRVSVLARSRTKSTASSIVAITC